MKHISINGSKLITRLETPVRLNNGSLILLKNHGKIQKVYMVVSFRDNKNRYSGESTSEYCSLLDLDDGYFSFEERCSRYTTVGRVLRHLLHFDSNCSPTRYGEYDIDCYTPENFKIDISI